ncbi:hypothetical protein L0F63_002712, partial [Massospora cicadina]
LPVHSFGYAADSLPRYLLYAGRGVALSPDEDLLTTPEILKLARIFVERGVNKIRLTGGEPTIRPDLLDLLAGLNKLKPLGLNSIGMTSNGIALKRKLPDLVKLGLSSLNLSLDTLDAFKFQIMTRRKGFEKVMECLDLAESLGIDQLKVNCVVMRGVNDTEVVDFVRLSQNHCEGNRWNDKKMVPYKELLSKITAEYPEVLKVQDASNDTAKACLFGSGEVSLRDMLRNGSSDEDLVAMISAVVRKKKLKHAVPCVASHPRSLEKVRLHSTRAQLSHIDPSSGKAKMVDVGDKALTKRVASAQSVITLSLEAFRQIRDPNKPYGPKPFPENKKGDVLVVAQIAGIQAAKMTFFSNSSVSSSATQQC